jgi:hypothetical protein
MNKQDKYNPDVNKKYEQITRDRESLNYSFSNQVYKGITHNFPTNVNKPEDLQIKEEEPNYDDIKSRMEDAMKEREREKIEQERKETLIKIENKKLQENLRNFENESDKF